MHTVNNPVIVWSIDDHNSLALLRQLGKSNLNLIFLIKGKAGYASKSKYCSSYVETKSIQAGYDYLMKTFAAEKYKPIIITACDEIITYIDQHRKEMDGVFLLPGTRKSGNVEKYIDKNAMVSLANEIGILCPQSKEVEWNSSIEGVPYPCLIKPGHQAEGHYNEFKFKICKTEAELKHTLRFVRHDSVFSVQQFIQAEKEVVVYGGRFYDGNTAIAGAIILDRRAANGATSHGYVTGDVPNCVDTHKITAFLEKIDYYGLFSFEYGLAADKAYFFEVNLRNDGTSQFFYQAGANIPLAYVYGSFCCRRSNQADDRGRPCS